MRDTRVFLNWHVGNTFGWGILGLNLFCHWANDPVLRPLMGQPITPESLGGCDPLRVNRAYRAIDASNRFLAALPPAANGRRAVAATVIDALGNDFATSECYGPRNVGRCIFENTAAPGARDAVAKYDALLVGSRWGADVLAELTGRQAHVIVEGVDVSLFCPGPKSGLLDAGKFYVFSGGKAEFRKGKDLVLLAFAKFAAGRDDCVLVTAWHSIWPRLSAGFQGRSAGSLRIGAHGRLDVVEWATQNGIDAAAVVDLGLVPNALMPMVLREMDVAVQPSRAEACTSLPVTEAMACGVPVIGAFNSGMKDLLNDDNSIVLKTQRPVEGPHASSTLGWGESSVDEIVAALEYVYENREEARRLGSRARQWLIGNDRTWKRHATELKDWLLA